jgi:hypothetical protein
MGLVNLSYHFQNNGSKNLEYELVLESDPAHLDGEINGIWVDVIQVEENWTGSAQFKIKGLDVGADGIKGTGDDIVNWSNIFEIEVTPVNDAPVITTVGGTAVTDGVPVEIAVEEDAESEIELDFVEGDGEQVLISTNITLANFDVLQADSGGPLIRYTPTNWDIGEIFMAVTAEDESGTSHTVDVVLNVANTNDPPGAVIDAPAEGLVAIEGVPIKFDGSRSSDLDQPHGDILNFTWYSNRSGVLSYKEKFETDLKKGHHRIKLKITDSESFSANAVVNISVLPENSIEIYKFEPAETFLKIPFEDYYQFQAWARVGETDLLPDYEWFVNNEKAAEDGPWHFSKFNIDMLELNASAVNEIKVVAHYSGAFTSHLWQLAWDQGLENLPPNVIPVQSVIPTIETGQSVTLEVDATDPEEDPLTYTWMVDGHYQPEKITPYLTFYSAKPGTFSIKVIVSDGTSERSHLWKVAVNEPISAPAETEEGDEEVEEAPEYEPKEFKQMSDLSKWALIFMIAAIVIALAAAAALRRRNKPKMPPPKVHGVPGYVDQSYYEGAAPGTAVPQDATQQQQYPRQDYYGGQYGGGNQQ